MVFEHLQGILRPRDRKEFREDRIFRFDPVHLPERPGSIVFENPYPIPYIDRRLSPEYPATEQLFPRILLSLFQKIRSVDFPGQFVLDPTFDLLFGSGCRDPFSRYLVGVAMNGFDPDDFIGMIKNIKWGSFIFSDFCLGAMYNLRDCKVSGVWWSDDFRHMNYLTHGLS